MSAVGRGAAPTHGPSPAGLVLAVLAAQTLVQLGSFTWPALLPGMIKLWSLTNSEAGWVTAAYYGAYMLAVPILVTLTDRLDAKAVYLGGVATTVVAHLVFTLAADGFWAAILARSLAGIGWAGTYMTGLKLVADRVQGTIMSRAVAGHAASIGFAGAISFVLADLTAEWLGWRGAFLVVAVTAALAWLIVMVRVPWRTKAPAAPPSLKVLFDFRPVLANRSAMAYAVAYSVHTLEMSAMRGWIVAFLAYVAMTTGQAEPWLSPAMTATLLGLVGTATSMLGNEASIRLGRLRLITVAMLGAAGCGVLMAVVGPASYPLAVALAFLYAALIWLDSASLTAGTAGTADPARRGATLAIHSMLGYAGGLVGPIAVGMALDASGGMSVRGWGFGFGIVALFVVAGLAVLLVLRPKGLTGDTARK